MVLAGTELYRDLGHINNIILIYILIVKIMVKYPTKHTIVQLQLRFHPYTLKLATQSLTTILK
ncbi:MAG: hypothetical protein COA76_00655 [Moritella sp.]|nr:MAG: hypothetical protein COA76_00655 [Moritella sp.]